MRQFLWLALLSTPIRYGGPSLWRTRTVSITNKKSHTGFLLVPTSVTLNDLERRNSSYFALFSPNSIAPQLITSQWLKIGPAIMSAKYRLPVIGQNWPTQQSLGLFATAKLLVKSRPDLGVPSLNFFYTQMRIVWLATPLLPSATLSRNPDAVLSDISRREYQCSVPVRWDALPGYNMLDEKLGNADKRKPDRREDDDDDHHHHHHH